MRGLRRRRRRGGGLDVGLARALAGQIAAGLVRTAEGAEGGSLRASIDEHRRMRATLLVLAIMLRRAYPGDPTLDALLAVPSDHEVVRLPNDAVVLRRNGG